MLTPSPFYFAHIVIATKSWEPSITMQLEVAIKDRLERNLGIRNSQLIVTGGGPEHIHLLGKFTNLLPLYRILGWSKGECSHWLNKNDPELNFYWQKGYWHENVDEDELDVVKNYILTQKDLHKSLSFTQEMAEMRSRGIL